MRDWRRALYTHPFWLIAGLFMAGLMLMALGGMYAEEKERRSFVAYSERLMQTFVERQQRELEKLARDYAIWDLFAEHAHGEYHDAEWLKKNVTESVYRNFDVADVLVLTVSLKPVFYLHQGKEARVTGLADWNGEFATALTRGIAKQPGLGSLSGFVRKEDGGLQLLVAERIRPEHPSSRDQGGGWLVFARNIDGKWLEESSHLLSVKNLAFANERPAEGFPQFALLNLERRPFTWLAWHVDRRQAVGLSTKPLLAGVLSLFLFSLLLARAVLRMHKRQLQVQGRMLQQSETLRRLSRAPNSSAADEAHYFVEIARSVRKELGAGHVTIWRADPVAGDAGCLAVAGERENAEEILYPKDHADFLGLLQELRVLVIADTGNESRFAGMVEYWKRHQVSAALYAAVIVRGRIAGVLSVEMSGEAGGWEPDQINFVSGAADLVAVALVSVERRRAEAALYRQQYYDTLTGLPNHDRLNHLLQRHLMEPGNRLVYSLWSVGELLHVNEEFGRVGGDQLLQILACRLDACVAPHITARLAGCRFVLVLLNESPADVSQEIEKTLYRLQEPVEIDGNTVFPKLACGVSIAPQDAFTVDELLHHAECALEAARSQNESPIEFYAPEPNTVARERYRLAGAMPAALTRGEFEVFFQPVVAVADRTIVGMEALLRWHHPEKGDVPPLQFIQIAEETGQIHALGRFVLEEACRCLHGWSERFGRRLQMAVNISPLQLRDAAFLPFLENTLKAHAIAPECLEVEITESVSLQLFEEIPERLKALRDMGVQLAIDDFGTGYSSLSYLRNVPASKLKIDRSFIENVPRLRHDADLARMIISMGQILDLSVVAEGVETEAQFRFLQEHGCMLAQGYFFSKPVNVAGMNMLLERGEVLAG
ncbi:GAF domain-containing protein [Formivibrio citricus]|uniref:GAF domain-containing protein n=2 Tax=Formivibrio citricus TaxID=83765 RepID=A0A1I4XUF3_9NEIS|nr:GAF domain-containing protein [Formivibrio citricus]